MQSPGCFASSCEWRCRLLSQCRLILKRCGRTIWSSASHMTWNIDLLRLSCFALLSLSTCRLTTLLMLSLTSFQILVANSHAQSFAERYQNLQPWQRSCAFFCSALPNALQLSDKMGWKQEVAHALLDRIFKATISTNQFAFHHSSINE